MLCAMLPLRTKFILLIFGLVVVLGIGAVDHFTGEDVSLEIFYVFPIALSSWWLGLLGGFTTALAAMAVWVVGELLAGQGYSLGVAYWNGGVRLAFFLIVVVSLSFRRRSHAALRQAEELLRALFEFAPDPMILVDEHGRIARANEQAVSAFGYTTKELAAMDAEALLAERFRSIQMAGNRYIGHPKLHHLMVGEPYARHKDGREFPVEVVVSPLEISGKQEVIAVIRNSAARRRGESARGLLAAIVESSDDAIIGEDLDGMITAWNQGAERLYGYSAKEAIGRPVAWLAPPEDAAELRAILERTRKGEPVEHREAVRRRKDGTLMRVWLVASPVRDPTGRIIGASTIARRLPDF
jgi:PAS domain S-box-containing protein